MPTKRILLLDGTRLRTYLWNRGHVKHELDFHPDPVGFESLSDYLQANRSSLFYLLADIAEEGFQLEDIPFVQGKDRASLLKRRLGQYYYGTPLSLALSLGRAKQGRRDEKILFAALTRPDSFTPWLDVIKATRVPLAGIYSVPLVLAEYGPQLAGPIDKYLIITLTHSGVRQSFFVDGKLHFSRLSQLATRGLNEVGIACATESAKIYQYLIGQRQLARGTQLKTLVLAHPDQIELLRGHCRNSSDLEFDFVDLAQVAKRDGLKESLSDSHADLLLAHRLAQRTPGVQFAPAEERHQFRLWQLRFLLTSTAWIILAGCLVWAGRTTLQTYGLQQQTDTIKAQTSIDNQRYKSILDGLPKTALAPDNLRAVISRWDDLQKRSPEMLGLLGHLGKALNETPKVELVELDWRVTGAPDGVEKVGASATAPNNGAGLFAVADIRAQLPLGLATDLRAQIELIENFAARLRSPQHDVRVTSMPFDIESGKALKSRSDAQTGTSADAPRFSLRIINKL